MINVVFDTNVVVSAALVSAGNPAQAIELVSADEDIQICYCADILKEYSRVLAYERLELSEEGRTRAIAVIVKRGVLVSPRTSKIPLPDESDRIFYDTAKAANAYLVTGNIKHYPEDPLILTPAQFVKMLEKNHTILYADFTNLAFGHEHAVTIALG